MTALTSLLQTLNTLSPLAVIALLGVVLFMLVKAKGARLLDIPIGQEKIASQVDLISNNHLSDLPKMVESLQRMEALLQNINDNIIYIRARVNGK